MNHDQFGRCMGQRLRLEPAAIGPGGRRVDDEWEIAGIDAASKSATLRNLTQGGEVVIGFDHVKSYDSDPANGPGRGFLTMVWQLRIARDGSISGRPIAPRQSEPAPDLDPIALNDGEAERHLTWASRDDALPQLPEGEPRQLYGTFVVVCDAVRLASGREPQFDAPNRIEHEIVWELTADHRSKHKLLGGMNGKAATSVLVLTEKRARPPRDRVADAAPPTVEAVDLDYPSRSGLQNRLAAEGFKLHWVREETIGRRQSEGWEIVVAEEEGRRVTFKVSPAMPAVDPSALVLMKRRT